MDVEDKEGRDSKYVPLSPRRSHGEERETCGGWSQSRGGSVEAGTDEGDGESAGRRIGG
jgi:hypothetical protein